MSTRRARRSAWSSTASPCSRLQPPVHLQVVDDLGCAQKAGYVPLRRLRIDREHPELAGEVLPGTRRAPGRRAARTSRHSVHGMPVGSRIPRAISSLAGCWADMRSFEQLRDERALQLGIDRVEEVRGVLFEPAERVAPPVGSSERQRLGLLAADSADGGQAARLRLQVEHLDADGRLPQGAVATAEHDALEAARPVMAGDDGLASVAAAGPSRVSAPAARAPRTTPSEVVPASLPTLATKVRFLFLLTCRDQAGRDRRGRRCALPCPRPARR